MRVYSRQEENEKRFKIAIEEVAVRTCLICKNRVGIREQFCSRCGAKLEPIESSRGTAENGELPR